MSSYGLRIIIVVKNRFYDPYNSDNLTNKYISMINQNNLLSKTNVLFLLKC